MKNVWILTCALAFVSVAGFAQTPGVAPLPSEALAAILSPPAVTGSTPYPTSPGKILFATCTATANCESGTVFCAGNSSCWPFDRSCPGERGHVTCDGVNTWCPTTCPSSPPNCDDLCPPVGTECDCCRCYGGTPAQCEWACG